MTTPSDSGLVEDTSSKIRVHMHNEHSCGCLLDIVEYFVEVVLSHTDRQSYTIHDTYVVTLKGVKEPREDAGSIWRVFIHHDGSAPCEHIKDSSNWSDLKGYIGCNL